MTPIALIGREKLPPGWWITTSASDTFSLYWSTGTEEHLHLGDEMIYDPPYIAGDDGSWANGAKAIQIDAIHAEGSRMIARHLGAEGWTRHAERLWGIFAS